MPRRIQKKIHRNRNANPKGDNSKPLKRVYAFIFLLALVPRLQFLTLKHVLIILGSDFLRVPSDYLT
jgi:hypothetical protein